MFLDTSVLIAASDLQRPAHSASIPLLAAASKETAACGVDTLAEVYAVLSRLRGGGKQRPELAHMLVLQILERLTVVPLTVEEYAATLRKAARSNLAGGIIFDALFLACARKFEAERIYTWNAKHFRMVAPDLAEKIRTP
jgi:predicted nucleic acid-binding protein